MPFTFFTPQCPRPHTPILTATAIAVATAVGLAAQDVRHLMRDSTGDVACVVHLSASSSRTRDLDRMAIDIRVPAPPPPLLLAKLPAARRDYSALPILVFLVPAPVKGERVRAMLPQVTPISADLVPKPLGDVPTAGTFVRVEYARAHLRAGVDLVAERTAVADSGEQVTTQTRCRIGAGDAIVWR